MSETGKGMNALRPTIRNPVAADDRESEAWGGGETETEERTKHGRSRSGYGPVGDPRRRKV